MSTVVHGNTRVTNAGQRHRMCELHDHGHRELEDDISLLWAQHALCWCSSGVLRDVDATFVDKKATATNQSHHVLTLTSLHCVERSSLLIARLRGEIETDNCVNQSTTHIGL